MKSLFKGIAADLRFYGGKSFGSKLLTFLFKPSFALMLNYRLGHYFILKRSTVLNLFVVYLKHRQLKYANCHISYEAVIGFNLNLPHPVGIVIGKGVVIEDNVTIYQNSTIGQKENNKYPLIKEYTTIYPNSIIVGDIVLGNHSIVGAHSYVDKSIGSGEIYFNKR